MANVGKDSMPGASGSGFVDIIKGLPGEPGLIQEQFTAKVGVTFSTVNRWENGRGSPSPLVVRRIEELREELAGEE